MSAPKAILFDWDNTLVESWDAIHHALVVTFTAMGHEPWSLDETKARVRLSLRDAFPAIFGARWEEARKLYLDTFTATHLERIAPVAGAAELLAELQARGHYLAVVSNKTGPVLRREAAHLGWSRFFAQLVGAGDAAADKPAAAPILKALEGTGLEPVGAWYIGDTAIDMECAANAGCLGVLLGALDQADAGFLRFPPALQFPACVALARHLKGL
ncbi:MAG TPA: HAD-IA family hydrolase [Stellaceae bacterium]|nr:HAD-IA family hydrolase [Stellaceae bacterium]